MNESEKAKRLLIGANMKIKAFYGEINKCAKDINEFFENKNVEIHKIKTTTSEKRDSIYGDILVIITYTEIK